MDRLIAGQFPSAQSHQDTARTEFAKLTGWLGSSRRDADTKLVTKGKIISPPFSASLLQRDGKSYAKIQGANDSITIEFSKIVWSTFRPNVLGLFVTDGQGIVQARRFLATMTKSYQKILAKFPPNSRFSTEELYAGILRADGKAQAHARRRWKELKYDYGFDVDSDENRSSYWRGPSETPINDPFPRPDDSKLRQAFTTPVALAQLRMTGKAFVECGNCGAPIQFPDTQLAQRYQNDAEGGLHGMLDHRRPIQQGGDDEVVNLQLFCDVCNNKKMTACKNCTRRFDCDNCMWAYPEKVRDRRLVLILESELMAALRRRFGSDLDSAIPKILREVAKK